MSPQGETPDPDPGLSGDTSFTYDGNGNLSGLDGATYTFDTENRLTGATASGQASTYLYTPFGFRRTKTVAGTANYYTPDALLNRDIAVFDSSFSMTSRYVYGPGIDEVIAWIDPNSGTNKSYYHQDGLGSTIATTNGAGAVSAQYSYSAYGLPTNTGSTAYMFTGRRYDFETGLYYYRNRAYNGFLGRFMQPDPIGTDGGNNLYEYTSGDPLNRTDPMGTCPMCIAALWAAGDFVADTSPVWGPYAAKMGIGFGVGYGAAAMSGVQSQEGRLAAGGIGALTLPVGGTLMAAGESLAGSTGATVAAGVTAYGAGYSGEMAGQLGDRDSGLRTNLDYSEANVVGLATVGAYYFGLEAPVAGAEMEGLKATGWTGVVVTGVTTPTTALLGLAGQKIIDAGMGRDDVSANVARAQGKEP